MPTDPIRIAVVDDHEVIRAGVEAMLRPYADRVCVVTMRDGATLDVALYDWLAGPDRYPEGVDAMLADPNVCGVVIYSWWSTPGLMEVAARRGVAGYVSKRLPAARLVAVIEQIVQADGMVVAAESDGGGIHMAGPLSTLTERESQVLALLIEGGSNRAIASALYVSIDTVKTHLRAVYRKLGVANRTQAVVRALETDF
ncbi:MAG: response regulator transcription factor [Acidimicrobiia bacterium]